MSQQTLSELQKFSSRDYLSWDEKSMRDLLVRLLSKSGVYTDQIYPGSDLSVLIDTISYMFSQLTYIVNSSASEALFTDTQFYENMNRLSKILGYNPKGFITASTECKIVINDEKYIEKFGNSSMLGMQSSTKAIPRYASILVSSGNIRYSLASGEAGASYNDYQQFPFIVDIVGGKPIISLAENPIFLNGTWKLYPIQPVSTGAPKEVFTMTSVGDELIAYPNIDVYVYTPEDASIVGKDPYNKWTPVTSLDDYGIADTVYSIRLNEKKQYEISFGDDVNGMKLKEGQVLYIIYLISNGDGATIDAGQIDGNGQLSVEIAGLTAQEIKKICFGGEKSFDTAFDLFNTSGSLIYSDFVSVENITPSTDPLDYESVQSIRNNAPTAFRTGRRLVNADDYRNFVLSTYPNQIRDCVVMNNYSYCAEFLNYIIQNWKQEGNPMIRIRQFNYRYADSCDFNNVYLWLRSTARGATSEFIKRAILNDTYKIKCLGAEPIPMDALATVFTPYVGGQFDVMNWDPEYTNRLVVIKDQSSLCNNDRVKENVISTITTFFSSDNQSIGGVVNLQQLYSTLLQIDGVKDIYTAYISVGKEIATAPGLSFTYWTPIIIRGSDRNVVVNSPVKMHNFQYAELKNPESLFQQVKVTSNNSFITSPEY